MAKISPKRHKFSPNLACIMLKPGLAQVALQTTFLAPLQLCLSTAALPCLRRGQLGRPTAHRTRWGSHQPHCTAWRTTSAKRRGASQNRRLKRVISCQTSLLNMVSTTQHLADDFPCPWRRVFPHLEALSTRHAGRGAQSRTSAPIREAGSLALAGTAP